MLLTSLLTVSLATLVVSEPAGRSGMQKHVRSNRSTGAKSFIGSTTFINGGKTITLTKVPINVDQHAQITLQQHINQGVAKLNHLTGRTPVSTDVFLQNMQARINSIESQQHGLSKRHWWDWWNYGNGTPEPSASITSDTVSASAGPVESASASASDITSASAAPVASASASAGPISSASAVQSASAVTPSASATPPPPASPSSDAGASLPLTIIGTDTGKFVDHRSKKMKNSY